MAYEDRGNNGEKFKQSRKQTTVGDLISALQDATQDDRLVATAFGDLNRRGIVEMDESTVMQMWLDAPEHLRDA